MIRVTSLSAEEDLCFLPEIPQPEAFLPHFDAISARYFSVKWITRGDSVQCFSKLSQPYWFTVGKPTELLKEQKQNCVTYLLPSPCPYLYTCKPKTSTPINRKNRELTANEIWGRLWVTKAKQLHMQRADLAEPEGQRDGAVIWLWWRADEGQVSSTAEAEQVWISRIRWTRELTDKKTEETGRTVAQGCIMTATHG